MFKRHYTFKNDGEIDLMINFDKISSTFWLPFCKKSSVWIILDTGCLNFSKDVALHISTTGACEKREIFAQSSYNSIPQFID